MIPHSHRRSLPVRGKEKSLRRADLGGGGVSSAEPAEAGEGACSDGTAVCDRAAASVRGLLRKACRLTLNEAHSAGGGGVHGEHRPSTSSSTGATRRASGMGGQRVDARRLDSQN